MKKNHSQWTSEYTTEKHNNQQEIFKEVWKFPLDFHLDLNAGPGVYNPGSSNVTKRTLCSGYYAAKMLEDTNTRVKLWEDNPELYHELMVRLLKGMLSADAFQETKAVHSWHVQIE